MDVFCSVLRSPIDRVKLKSPATSKLAPEEGPSLVANTYEKPAAVALHLAAAELAVC
jgi:hypothetical protein